MRFLSRLILLLLLVADLVSKFFATKLLQHTSLRFTFFRFSHFVNKGLAFSLFSNVGKQHPHIFISFITIIFFLYCYSLIFQKQSTYTFYGGVLICIGGLGNLLNRVAIGGVTDFIQIAAFGIKSSVFNLADVYIIIGMILIVLSGLQTMLPSFFKTSKLKHWKNRT